MDELADRLALLFLAYGYTWNIDGQDRVPTSKDLGLALDKLRETLYAEPTNSQIEMGRLIMTRPTTDTFDVYLQIGNI